MATEAHRRGQGATSPSSLCAALHPMVLASRAAQNAPPGIDDIEEADHHCDLFESTNSTCIEWTCFISPPTSPACSMVTSLEWQNGAAAFPALSRSWGHCFRRILPPPSHLHTEACGDRNPDSSAGRHRKSMAHGAVIWPSAGTQLTLSRQKVVAPQSVSFANPEI